MKQIIFILLSIVCLNVYASDYITNNLRYSNNNYTLVVRSDNPYEHTPILVNLGNKQAAISYLETLISNVKNADTKIKVGKYNTTLFTEIDTYEVEYNIRKMINSSMLPNINDYYTLLFPNPNIYTAGTYRIKLTQIVEAYDKIRN